MTRQPSIFLPHGGGPCFWMERRRRSARTPGINCESSCPGIVASLPARPKALLIVTAHWEEAAPTVSVDPAPGMIFDYYDFPPHTYELKYKAPGAPELGRRAAALIRAAGLPVAEDAERGYDHGVFVPMLIVDPRSADPGGDGFAAARTRPGSAHRGRPGAGAAARRRRRHRRQRHELPRPPAFPRRRRPRRR